MSREVKAAQPAIMILFYALLSILQKKCEEYWPLNVDESIHPGHGINVALTSILPFAEYSVRKLTVTCVSNEIIYMSKYQICISVLSWN